MSDVFGMARAAAARLRAHGGNPLREEIESAVVFALWRFDAAHPDATDRQRQAVANRRAIDAARKWTHHSRRHPAPEVFSIDVHHTDPSIEFDYSMAPADILTTFPPPFSKNPERDRAIILAWLGGDTVTELAQRHGVDKSRVSQIVAAYARQWWELVA